MKKVLFMIAILSILGAASGCETVKKGTTKAGEVVGKGADSLGGLTEGAVEGYSGAGTTEENPYER